MFGEVGEEDDENENKDERTVWYRQAPGVTSLHHSLSMRMRTRAARARAQAGARAKERAISKVPIADLHIMPCSLKQHVRSGTRFHFV